jgi:hypothetical protein
MCCFAYRKRDPSKLTMTPWGNFKFEHRSADMALQFKYGVPWMVRVAIQFSSSGIWQSSVSG